MRLSEQAISDFQAIMSEEFNMKLSDDEANTKGIELLMTFKEIIKPIPINKEKCAIMDEHSGHN